MSKPYHRDPPAPCTQLRTITSKSSRPCPRTRGSDDPQAKAEAMSVRTYKLSDQDWQHPAFDTIYRWIMNRWDDLHTRYEQETKGYNWLDRPKQWRNAEGRNMDRILSDYPNTITQPIGRILYTTTAWDRTRNTIKKTETAIAHQDGTCTITDSRIHIALAEAGTIDIHLSEARPYRLPRIVVTVRKGR